jgi:tetratricopeptide (TPR) repeat protein
MRMKGVKFVVLGLMLALMIAPGRSLTQSLDELYRDAGVAESNGNYAEFENIIRKAIQLYPNEARPYYGLGIVLQDQGKLEDAIAAYRQAIALDPKYAPAYYNLGIALGQQGKLEEAIAAYRQAIVLDPKFVYAYNNLGNALLDQKKLEDAIATYRQAIALALNMPVPTTVWGMRC